MGQGDPGSQHQGGVRPISCRYSIRPDTRIAGADVRQQALRCDRADCIVEDCEQAVRGLRKGILLQHVPVRAGHLGAFAHGLRRDRDEVVA